MLRPGSIAANILALVLGGLVLFLEMWTIVPAPTLPTLTLAVLIPEITPWAIGFCAIAFVVAQTLARGWARDAGVLCAAFALGCAILPWCLVPSTVAACEAEMRLGFGHSYTATDLEHSADAVNGPYRVFTALAGYRNRAPIRVRRDLPVRTRDGRRLGLDVYTPTTPGAHPTVVVIYGGAWIFGSRADSAPVARDLARRGYTAIAVDYRHAPVYRFPTQIDDVRDALATIAANASAWNVDTKRVALFGRSAGAELALLAAYEPEPLTIRAAVGYYTPTDLITGYDFPPKPDPADVGRILRAYIGGPPFAYAAGYIAASPVRQVRRGLPPTLLIAGGRDELVRLAFQHQMRDALRERGVPVAALDLPWSNHAFDSIPNGTGGQIARYFTNRFFAATL